MAKHVIHRSHIKEIKFTIPDSLKQYDDYPKITNYVSTVYFGVKFNVNGVSLYLSSSDRKPRRFAATTIRIKPTTGLLFSTGKMVVSGAKTEHGSILAAHTYRLFLEKIPQIFYDKCDKKFFYSTLEKYSKFEGFKVQNVVGSGKLFNTGKEETQDGDFAADGIVDLDSFARNHIVDAGWDREIFPGMRFNIEKSEECPLEIDSIMTHVFEAANDVLMGAKNKRDIYLGHNHLKKVVAPYSSALENKQESMTKKIKIIEDAIKNASSITMEKKGKKRKIPRGKKMEEYEDGEELFKNPRKKQKKEDDTYDKYINSIVEMFTGKSSSSKGGDGDEDEENMEKYAEDDELGMEAFKYELANEFNIF